MTLYNPSFEKSLSRSSASNGQQLRAQIQRTKDLVYALVAFVTEEHLTAELFRAFWRQEARAILTLRAISKTLGLDIAEIARAVHEHLEYSAEMDLLEFQVGEAAYLFSLIDSIQPDELLVGDGRVAAEKFQYAVEARTALLRYALHVLIQRYSPSFHDATLADTRAWLQAFLDLLEEAKEVVLGTQQLLWDEATAIQSYLDTLQNRFALYREQAHAAALLIREDWTTLLRDTEAELLDYLEKRQEQLEKLAVGELDEPWERSWLETLALRTARHAPVVGSLLLSLTGMKALHTAGDAPRVVPRMPELREIAPLREGLEGIAESVQGFPVLARVRPGDEVVPSSESDEIARFFNAAEHPRGRQTLTISDSDTLLRVLDELSRFGYARRDVLRLFGMNSVSDLAGPMSMDVRWGQGGRPLLLPPYEASAPLPSPQERHIVHEGAPLSLVAQRFGLTEEQILSENPALGEGAGVTEGEVIRLPAIQNWAEQRNGSGRTIGWGATLEWIARELNLSVEALADLNDIPNPDTWMYTGAPLRVPIEPGEVTGAAEADAPAAPIPPPELQVVGEKKPVYSLIVHYVEEGESLDAIAARYQSTVSQLMEDNHFEGHEPAPGDLVLVRVGGRVVHVIPDTGAPGATTSHYDAPGIRSQATFAAPFDLPSIESGGSFEGAYLPAPLPPLVRQDEQALVAAYGSTLFPSIEAMPDDLRLYFTTTVQEVADFFNVRPGDIIGILQAENNNAGLRLHQPAVSSAGARGVAQVIARTWNGWANPHTESHTRDLLSIEQHGGIGFDWSAREAWREWKEGRSDGSILAGTNADPDRFDNGVAAIARHLVHWGLTRDRAASDPEWFRQQLRDAISVYNSGRPYSEAAAIHQSSANRKTTAQYVDEAIAISEATPSTIVARPVDNSLRDIYRRLADRTLAISVSDEALARTVDESAMAVEVQAGRISAEEGARRLWMQTVSEYMAQGQRARERGEPLPWPYIYDERSLATQRIAVQLLGSPLNEDDLEALIASTGGEEGAVRDALSSRGDARLFAESLRFFDEALQRAERRLPVRLWEVAALVRPAVAGYNPRAMDDAAIHEAMERVRQAIRSLPEYRELHGESVFPASPLQPAPRIVKAYGVPVDYQAGGIHTGVDLVNPRVNGAEPELFAVADGTVAYVGPLYCDADNACRGDHAIIIDHGNHVYTIYSHNSEATVTAGQQVRAGQSIGRQGDEGYSFGAHLHLEVHTGAPFSGDWREPWHGGQFEDPMKWLSW